MILPTNLKEVLAAYTLQKESKVQCHIVQIVSDLPSSPQGDQPVIICRLHFDLQSSVVRVCLCPPSLSCRLEL